MPGRHQRQHLVAEQRTERYALVARGFRHDHQVGLVLVQQRQRIGVKAAHQVHLHLRPVCAIGVHARHQPVVAGVALHRDAQFARLVVLGQPGQVARGGFDYGQHLLRQRQQPHTRRRGAQRAAAFEQRHAVMRFQRHQLMRQRRLGQVQAGGSACQTTAVIERLDHAQMFECEHV